MPELLADNSGIWVKVDRFRIGIETFCEVMDHPDNAFLHTLPKYKSIYARIKAFQSGAEKVRTDIGRIIGTYAEEV